MTKKPEIVNLIDFHLVWPFWRWRDHFSSFSSFFHIFLYFATKKSEIVHCLDFSSISAFFFIFHHFSPFSTVYHVFSEKGTKNNFLHFSSASAFFVIIW
jgi:hypothetical protein